MTNLDINGIYKINDKIQDQLKAAIDGLSTERLTARINDEKWTIGEVLEHTAIVEDFLIGICAKLLDKAPPKNGKPKEESVISDDFMARILPIRESKFKTPEMLQPTGINTPNDWIQKLEENRRVLSEMREKFETADLSQHKIAHPVAGELMAHEWLFYIGEHKTKHLNQIKALIGKLS